MQKPIALINQTTMDSLSDADMILLAVKLGASFLCFYPIHHYQLSNFEYNIVGLGKYIFQLFKCHNIRWTKNLAAACVKYISTEFHISVLTRILVH